MTKKITECQLYLYAHLLAGKPDLDLPWDPDLQQEKNKAQQSSRRHAHTMKVSLTSNSNFTLHSITREECSALVQQAFLGTSQKNPFSLIPHSICQETTVQAQEAPQQSSAATSTEQKALFQALPQLLPTQHPFHKGKDSLKCLFRKCV